MSEILGIGIIIAGFIAACAAWASRLSNDPMLPPAEIVKAMRRHAPMPWCNVCGMENPRCTLPTHGHDH